MNYKSLPFCLCCESLDLVNVIDLGEQSPANNYSITDKYPLALNVCKKCSHLQLSHSVDPDVLFSNYPYMSGVSQTMKDYYKKFATLCIEYMPEALNVLEIACNDGSQLDVFQEMGFHTFGIEPAKNIYEIANKRHYVINDFFPCKFEVKPDIIVAQNVFAHVPEPLQFLNGCFDIMTDESHLFIQNSQTRMLEQGQFDTIYHEHISFFNIKSLQTILSRAGLVLHDTIYQENIHGGSMVYVIKKKREIDMVAYERFNQKSQAFKDNFIEVVESYRSKGYKTVVYGAAAKMINMLRFTGVKPDYIIDETPFKIGQTIPGIGTITDKMPTGKLLVIPVWNFFDEIYQKTYRDSMVFLKYYPIIKAE